MLNKKRFRLALIWFTIASTLFACTQAYTTTPYCEQNNYGVNIICYEIAPNEEFTIKNNTNTITENLNFNSIQQDNTYKEFYYKSSSKNREFNFFWNNWRLYFMYYWWTENYIVKTYTVDNFCNYNWTDRQGIINKCWMVADNNYTNYTYTRTWFKQNVIDNNRQLQSILFEDWWEAWKLREAWYKLCLIYSDETFCLNTYYHTSNWYEQGTQTFEDTTSHIPNSTEYFAEYFENSPITAWWWNWWTTITTWTICPMIKFQIDMYWSKYNTWLCYTNTIEYTWWSIQTVTPKSIFEIFTWYQQYINWYNLRNNHCHAPYTQEHCTQVMQENWRAVQIFNKIEKAWVDSQKVYQYCHLQLDFTEEEKRTIWTCQIEEKTEQQYYATWVNQQQSWPNPLEWITNVLEDGTLDEPPIPSTWTVFDEILPDGVLSRKDVLLDYNFYSHFSMLYIKITKLFQARWEQEGIIPPYITSLLLLILLFKIYKK